MEKIELDVDELGRGNVVIDGKDVSCSVRGFRIVGHVGELTEIELLVRGKFEFTGVAKLAALVKTGIFKRRLR